MTYKEISRNGKGRQVSSFNNFRNYRKGGIPTPSINTEGLVLYYDFGNGKCFPNTNTTVLDLSAQVNNGTLTNGPVYNRANNGIITFDGTNDSISCGNPASLNVLNFTICVWVRNNSFSNYQNAIFKGSALGGQYGLIFDSTGDWAIQPNIGASFVGDPISLNTWNFFAGTYNGTSTTTFRNGIQKSQYAVAQSSKGTVVSIGADTVNGRYLNGSIGQAMIYNRPLSSSEIWQNFNATRGIYGI